MVWMGSKADIAAIIALDTTGLQDNIVFAAASELKFLLLNKTSTATVDNATVWAATPAGRWLLTGVPAVPPASSSIEVVANLAALQALTSASQNKLYALDTTPPQLFSWDATSTATVSDDIIKLTALTTGRMYRFYPVASSGGGSSNLVLATSIAAITALNTSTFPNGIQYYAIAQKMTLVLDKTNSSDANDLTCWAAADGTACWFAHPSSVIISENPPPSSGAALLGTTWIWAELDYDSDQSLSVITYVWPSDSSSPDLWQQIHARIRKGTGNPTTGSIPINGNEFWVDQNSNFLYYAYQNSEFGNSWQKVLT